jgi:hypothetical protein
MQTKHRQRFAMAYSKTPFWLFVGCSNFPGSKRRSATQSECVGMQLNKARDAGQKEESFIECIILACREIWYFIIKMLTYTHLEEFVQEC